MNIKSYETAPIEWLDLYFVRRNTAPLSLANHKKLVSFQRGFLLRLVQRPRLPPFLLVQKRSLAMICTSCKNKRPIPTLRPNPRRESSQTLLGECFLLVLPPPWGSSLGSDTSKQNRVCLQPDRFCWNSASADAFIHVFLRVFQTIQSQA